MHGINCSTEIFVLFPRNQKLNRVRQVFNKIDLIYLDLMLLSAL